MGNKDNDKDKDKRQHHNSTELTNLISGSSEIIINEDQSSDTINKEGETSSETKTKKTQSTQTTVTDTSTQCEEINTALHDEIVKTSETLRAINTTKEELCKLPLNLCERQYFDNRVLPLITTINFLSTTSINLATSVNILTTSPIVPRKKGKLRSTIKLIYEINSKCNDIYNELENRIDIMMNEE